MIEPKRILLAEDNPHDVEMTIAALRAHNLGNEIVVVQNGELALDYHYARGQFAGRPGGVPP